MRPHRSVALTFLAGLVLAQANLVAECISSEPILPIKPIPASGALCGKAVDQVGGPLANHELELIAEAGIITRVTTDSAAAFKFPPLPAGEYRIGAADFITSRDIIAITSRDQQTCERPLTVHLSFTGSECAASRITTGSGIRLEIWPKFGAVGIDGVFSGNLSELSGASGFWPLAPGKHHVVVQSPGYEMLVLDVVIKDYEILTYSGSMTEATPHTR